MIRTSRLAIVLLALSACAADDLPQVPVATTVVGLEAGFARAPDPSPDGTRLAWTQTIGGRAAIFVGDTDGSNPVQLTHGVWDTDPLWSPDGSMIAYMTEADDDVWVVPSAGGEPRQLTSGPAGEIIGEWMPDGSAVVVYRWGTGTAQTFLVPIDGSPERRLGPEMDGDQYASLSPDGTKLAFNLQQSGASTIWVQTLDGSPPRQLTTEGLEYAAATLWSPDGRRLLYSSRQSGTGDIWTVDVATGETHQVTTDLRGDFNAVWSPDGNWIAFGSDRGGQTDLWLVRSEGGPAKRVTNDRLNEGRPRWSPNGRTLYFDSWDGSTTLEVASLTGGEATTLLDWKDGMIWVTDLTPDGTTAIFSSDRSGSMDLWTVPLAGGEPTPLVVGTLAESSGQYSPDGEMVVFVSNRGGSQDLWAVSAAGGEPVQLTDWPSDEYYPRWSPDGSMIAFVTNHEAASSSLEDIWVVPAAGGEPRRVTRLDAPASNVQWSPDGATLYFVSTDVDGGRDLFAVGAGGGIPKALGASPGIRWGGELSPDGTNFAYANFVDGWAYVEVISTDGGTPRRLSDDGENVYDQSVRWMPDGRHLLVQGNDLVNLAVSLSEVSWPDGTWRSIDPGTPQVDIRLGGITPDGERVLLQKAPLHTPIMSVSVAELLSGP